MKVWEYFRDIYKDYRKALRSFCTPMNGDFDWEKFSKDGSCVGLPCSMCPIQKGNCSLISKRISFLNEDFSMTKHRRMTNKELARWLREKPNRQCLISKRVYGCYAYLESSEDEVVVDDIYVREGDEPWHIPVKEGIDVK